MTTKNKKSIYRDSNTNHHLLVMFWALSMIVVSAYLTNHYYALKYPTGLESASFCEINSFFSCEKATNSILSNIFGIPLSIYGILIGVLILLGYMFKNDEYESTLHYFLILNFGGCLVLFLYSIVALGGLCPFCTLYYIISGLAAFHFYKKSQMRSLHSKPLIAFSLAFLIFSGSFYVYTQSKNKKINSISESLLKEYYSYPNLGQPKTDSPFLLAKSGIKFSDSPIQITIFSDFQCPACKALSKLIHQIEQKYRGKINIQYFFYPLDNNCNPAMKRSLHRFACQASYLTFCLPQKFSLLHDEIFENQDSLSTEWLNNLAKREKVLECMNHEDTKKSVVEMIKAATPFNIRSTPTMIINGVKIEGVFPLAQLYIILDSLLKKK